jgi:hypothetical protein
MTIGSLIDRLPRPARLWQAPLWQLDADAVGELVFAGAGVRGLRGLRAQRGSCAATGDAPGRARHGTVGQPFPGTTVPIANNHKVRPRG